MAEYLSQWFVDEYQLKVHRDAVALELDGREAELLRWRQYPPMTFAVEEYAEWSRRCAEQRDGIRRTCAEEKARTLARLDAEAEAVRARMRAVPTWPYDPDEEVIGDGQRNQSMAEGALWRGVAGPGTPAPSLLPEAPERGD